MGRALARALKDERLFGVNQQELRLCRCLVVVSIAEQHRQHVCKTTEKFWFVANIAQVNDDTVVCEL